MERKFNLLDEPWIVVMVDNKGSTKEVSLKELFTNAHQFKQLAGDSPTQDFAIFRVLIAVLQTVFSRFDAVGEIYEWLKLSDETWQVVQMVDSEDTRNKMAYKKALYQTWKDLWDKGEFPIIIGEYLEKYRDRFNLIDEKYPFYQVTKEQLESKGINKVKPVYGKTFNRTISESSNKQTLFSNLSNENKNLLTKAEFTRWLINFQGYTGTSDKTKYPGVQASVDKGWLFRLGCIYLSGENLFQTLMLNLIQVSNEYPEKILSNKTPIWERDFESIVLSKIYQEAPNNLAELYTNWSRLVTFDGNFDNTEICPVGLPSFDGSNFFLEPMTLWTYSAKKGEEYYFPATHKVEKFFWRDFGALSIPSSLIRHQPGIISWLDTLKEKDFISQKDRLRIIAVGLISQGAPSNIPINEILDDARVNLEVLTDKTEDGWITRIEQEIEKTESAIEKTIVSFAKKVQTIRRIKSIKGVESVKGFASNVESAAYFAVDQPFRKWLSEINPTMDKEKQIYCWRSILRKTLMKQADELVQSASSRDFLGNNKENIESAYNQFLIDINKILPEEATNFEQRNL